MVRVVLTGDFHIGQNNNMLETLKHVKNTRWKDKPVLLMGDLIDMGKDRGMNFDSALQPQEQVNALSGILKGLNVAGYIIGNHEKRIFKAVGLNPYITILNMEPKHVHMIGGCKFYIAHGNSAGKNPLLEFDQILQCARADVIALGHSHELGKWERYTSEGRVTLLRTGSFLKSPIYATEKHMTPKFNGWIEYDTQRRIAHVFAIIGKKIKEV